MKYMSIDIETTGLDPDQDQILEIAAVVDNGGPIDTLPRFSMAIRHDRVSGSPKAMQMNAALLGRIAEWSSSGVFRLDTVEMSLRDFLYKNFGTEEKIIAAGKNFASFDRQFIRRAMPKIEKLFHHRSIDPAMWFIEPGDSVLPSTEVCLTRAGYDGRVKHEALDDAMNTVRLIRYAGKL